MLDKSLREGSPLMGIGRMRILFSKLRRSLPWLTGIASVLTIMSFVAPIVRRIQLGWIGEAVQFLGSHSTTVWLSTITLALLLLASWTWSLHRRSASGFHDDFKGSLAEHWDYVGDWRITESNELLVTQSDPGGLTKTGVFWENYTLEFEAKILNVCLGVIVRAQDLNNYYMFQIQKDRIRPHRRVTLPVQSQEITSPEENKQQLRRMPVEYAVLWDIPPDMETEIDSNLGDWFKVKLSVHGEAVSIKVDGKTVFVAESFLKHSAGKVGFRNSGAEKALVRQVRVKLEP